MNAEDRKFLAVYIVISMLLVVTGYFFVVHVMHQSEGARIISLIFAIAALYVLAKWGYPR